MTECRRMCIIVAPMRLSSLVRRVRLLTCFVYEGLASPSELLASHLSRSPAVAGTRTRRCQWTSGTR